MANVDSTLPQQEENECHAETGSMVDTAATGVHGIAVASAEEADQQHVMTPQAQQINTTFQSSSLLETVHSDTNKTPETWECTCGDSFGTKAFSDGTVILLNCGHARCMNCLNENIQIGLASRKNFPPRCCGPIDLDDIMAYVRPNIVIRWNNVREEYTDTSPVYCGVQTCSAYLPKSTYVEGTNWANCSVCNLETCTTCIQLRSQHKENLCPERLDKLSRELMRREGWRSCPNCKHIIEKAEGCNHTQCECGHEFCYLCGSSYRGGLPCNCQGQNDWVEDEPDEDDLDLQQQILDEIQQAAQSKRESENNAINHEANATQAL